MSEAVKGFLLATLIAVVLFGLWYATTHNVIIINFPKIGA